MPGCRNDGRQLGLGRGQDEKGPEENRTFQKFTRPRYSDGGEKRGVRKRAFGGRCSFGFWSIFTAEVGRQNEGKGQAGSTGFGGNTEKAWQTRGGAGLTALTFPTACFPN